MAVAGIAAGLIQRPLHPLQHCTTLKFQLGSLTLESGEQENSHRRNFSGTNRFALCSGLCGKSLSHLSAKCCWLRCALSGGFSQEARIPGNDQADTWVALRLISAYWLKQLLTITWNRCNLQRAGLRITWNLCNPQLGLEPILASAGSVGPTQYLVDSPKALERTENNS